MNISEGVYIPFGNSTEKMLINVSNIYKYFNGIPLLKDINLTVENHETIGLIGSNGCGKTTLLNIITGQEEFDKTSDGLGSVSISNNVNIGYLHQNSGLETSSTIKEEMLKAFSKLISVKKKMKNFSPYKTIENCAAGIADTVQRGLGMLPQQAICKDWPRGKIEKMSEPVQVYTACQFVRL